MRITEGSGNQTRTRLAGLEASCQREAMAAPTCARALAQEASWARTTPPLFNFSVYRLAIGREGINPWAEQ